MKRSVYLALVVGCLFTATSAFGVASLSVTNGCAQNGTNFGLAVTMNGVAGGPAYVQDPSPNNEATFRAEFWLDPESYTHGGTQTAHTVYSAHRASDGAPVLRVDYYRLAGGTNRVRASCRRDNETFASSSLITIDQAGVVTPRRIQIEWAAGAGTGFCRLTRFGGANPSVELNNITNGAQTIKRSRLGAVVGIDAGGTGTYCLDEFASFQ